LSLAQINPFRPSASPSATDSLSFPSNVKIFGPSTLTGRRGSVKLFFLPGPCARVYCFFFSRRYRGQGVRLTTHLPLMLKVRNEWSCNSTPSVCFHVVDKQRLYLYLYHSYCHKQIFPAAVGTDPHSVQTLVSF